MKALSPVTSRKGSLEQQGAHDIVDGTNHAFNLIVLWGRVGTRRLKLDIVRKEEGASGGVVKLTSIIALDTPDGTTKLCGHISKKVRAWGMCQTYGIAERSISNDYNHPE
jgi:hypothetical protein